MSLDGKFGVRTRVIAGLILIGLLAWLVTANWYWIWPSLLDEGERKRWELVTRAVTVITALVGGIWGLWFTNKRIRASEENVRLVESGQVTDRFKNAVEMLGSEQLTTRLGGIYALRRVAIDSPEDFDTVISLLCSFVRSKRPNLKGEGEARFLPNDVTKKLGEVLGRLGEDEKAALKTVLVDLSRNRDVGTVDLSRVDLSGLRLSNVNLTGADLGGTRLVGVSLKHADCRGTSFVLSDLSNARLEGANLAGAKLYYASCKGAHFEGASFRGADLEGADLSKANLAGADFRNARTEHAKFDGAHLDTKTLPKAFKPQTKGLED